MYDYSPQELTRIDKQLDPILTQAAEHSVETQQLALDATRILSCTEDRLEDYKSKGFFKRLWYKLNGKTDALERANQKDLIEMQKMGWRYLTILQERDLMLAHSIIAVKNNLLTLAVKEEETRKSIIELANRISLRFIALEGRVDRLEVATGLHAWLLTLTTYDYDEKYPPYIRLLKIVRDFYRLKPGDWTLQEIKYLQKAVSEVGLDGKSRITIDTFINGIVDEIEDNSLETFRSLVCLPADETGSLIPSKFVLEEIAVPFYSSLARIEEDYDSSMRTIKVLAKQLSISSSEAHKQTLVAFVEEDGIDITATIPLRDLAVELLVCMGMIEQLYHQKKGGQPLSVYTKKKEKAKTERQQLIDSDKDDEPDWEVFNRGRFIINKETGIVKDNKTELEWLVGPDRQTSAVQAQNWIDSLDDGWRLPEIPELAELYNSGVRSDAWGFLKRDESRGIRSNEEDPALWDFIKGGSSRGPGMFYSGIRAFAVRSGG